MFGRHNVLYDVVHGVERIEVRLHKFECQTSQDASLYLY